MEAVSQAARSIPRCCCGSQDCAFLAHNSSLLEHLERDVSKAAQLGQVCPGLLALSPAVVGPRKTHIDGQMDSDVPLTFALQALLIRHEAYVEDSERERRHMTATIENLEKEKLELEERNAETIRANRDLLDQLEQLNEAVADSDAQVKALTDTLHSTEEEIQRLSVLAARTQSLERQLIDLEREQMALHTELDGKIGDERTAIQRWRRAERTIGDLQDQMDRIEQEAKNERERHVEIVARMERRMAVDGELATAAGRLQAKAGHEKAGTNVVSHFVKDILVDNANLQNGILELREMLQNSNEEVERLRDQLRVHQPASPTTEDVPALNTLKTELANEMVSKDSIVNQELHIHHHYHGPAPKKEVAKGPIRRPKKKRYSLTPSFYTPSQFMQPSQPKQILSATILSQTSVTVPSNTNRWSNATTLAPSSLPGSPLSVSHRESLHDRVFSDAAYDSSRPTSPSDSVNLASPMFEPSRYIDGAQQEDITRHRRGKSQGLKPPSLATIRSVSSPISLTAKSSPATAIISTISPANSLSTDLFMLSPSIHSTIPEENEDGSGTIPEVTPGSEILESTAFIPDAELEEALSSFTPRRPNLRRAASHESLISVSGMDIHTLQSRPSQLLFSSTPYFGSPNPTSSQPILTPWTATATAHMSKRELDSSTLNKSLLYGSLVNQKRGVSTPLKSPSPGLGKKVGGWVFGKWGATPAPSRPASSASDQSGQTQNSGTPSAGKKPEPKNEPPVVKLRPAGVNQSGPIWGFFDAVPPAPENVQVTDFDAEALGEALGES
jgi:hypothetical protein